MTDKEAALAACDSAEKDRLARLAGVFMDEYAAAEGKPNAEALRQASGERFQAGMKVLAAAHAAAEGLVGRVFPLGAAAGG
ncbi:MAG TPA: hypothetical protein VMU19_04855 [Bryobacteraceae bacterium]|nr:hypothetical protein [Bryobacteraceae bacterium]